LLSNSSLVAMSESTSKQVRFAAEPYKNKAHGGSRGSMRRRAAPEGREDISDAHCFATKMGS